MTTSSPSPGQQNDAPEDADGSLLGGDGDGAVSRSPLPPVSPSTLDIALFASLRDPRPARESTTWPKLVQLLTRHGERADKDGPMWSPTKYPDGTTRGKASVQSVYALVLDYDHEQPTWAAFETYAYVAHTTHRHTPEAPRWRVVLPLASSVPAEEWPDVWSRAQAHFGSEFDAQCKDASRAYFLPSCPPGGERDTRVHIGAFLDASRLPALPVTNQRAPVEPTSSPQRTAYAQSALEREVGRVAVAVDGSRNVQLNRAAFALGQLVGAGVLEQDTVEGALMVAAERADLPDDEAWRTIQSGLTAGMREPRELPDWAYQQEAVDGRIVDTRTGEVITEPRRESAKARLERIAQEAELIRTREGALYAWVPAGGRRHLHRLPGAGGKGGGETKLWLVSRYKDTYGTTPPAKALDETLLGMSADALHHGTVRDVYTRVAHVGGVMYLDLADDENRAIRITPQGWDVVDDAPVIFRRPPSMLPLPVPMRGGSLDTLRESFVRVSDEDWHALVGGIVMMLHPRGPYPCVLLHGEQGSGKSSLTRYLRSLVDPSRVLSRGLESDERNLAIQTRSNWVLAFDNVSGITAEVSDLLCRVSTGAGFGTRQLYSNDAEEVFDGRRMVLLNAINEVGLRPDFVDRCLRIHCLRFERGERRPEAEVDAQFAAEHPRLLGALLDATATALAHHSEVELPDLPRMADMAAWITAAEPALGWEPGTFLRAYQGNRDSGVDLAIEASVIGAPLLGWLEEQKAPIQPMTAAELLQHLERFAGIGNVMGAKRFVIDTAHWPRNAIALSGELGKLTPALRARGWVIEGPRRSNGRRVIDIRRVESRVNSDTNLTLSAAQSTLSAGSFELKNGHTGSTGSSESSFLRPLEKRGSEALRTGERGLAAGARQGGTKGGQPSTLSTLPLAA